MRNIAVSIVMTLSFCFGFVSGAKAEPIKSNPQFLLVHGQEFGDWGNKPSICGYLHIAVLTSLSGGAGMPLYAGGKVGWKDLNVSFLGGVLLDSSGKMDPFFSEWTYAELTKRVSVFLQADYRLSKTIYAYASLARTNQNGMGVGVAYENVTDLNDGVKESAVGPMLILGKTRLWLAPDLKNKNVLVRVVFSL